MRVHEVTIYRSDAKNKKCFINEKPATTLEASRSRLKASRWTRDGGCYLVGEPDFVKGLPTRARV